MISHAAAAGPFPTAHYLAEEVVHASGLDCTIIQPTSFAQHLLTNPALFTASGSTLFLPTGDAGVAWLDCRDIAAAAVELVTMASAQRAAWRGRVFEFTGPQPVTATEMGEHIGCLTGRSIDVVADEQRYLERGGPRRFGWARRRLRGGGPRAGSRK